MKTRRSSVFLLALSFSAPFLAQRAFAEEPTAPALQPGACAVLRAAEAELARSSEQLKSNGEHPLYFLSYTIWEAHDVSLQASYGALTQRPTTRRPDRSFAVSARVGSSKLDNTHAIRGSYGWSWSSGGGGGLPVEDDVEAIRAALWLSTDRAYKNAQERFTKVLTDRKVMVDEEDLSDDFSSEEPSVYMEDLVQSSVDQEAWAVRLPSLSAHFKKYPHVLDSSVSLTGGVQHRWFLSSEGTRLQTSEERYRIGVYAEAKADDGMDLHLYESFFAPDTGHLPSDADILAKIERVASALDQLRAAPVVEPYVGPAILVHEAAAVFFHEIFGHRIEGHRQKDEDEGQTFTKKVGTPIMPDFISIYEDPTAEKYGDIFLMGHYDFDDEGVRAERVTIVENGILKSFLMSRSPVRGFPRSNGHGRCESGSSPVSRMANMIVQSSRRLPFDRLRAMLIEEANRQGKPYGLIFHDIAGGFTTTGRWSPQAFKVEPLLVTRVYVDGRPDEMVRGVDICGTPIMSLEQILATGDDESAFHGYCGAESGSIPVSAVSPSVLVGKIEVEKKQKSQSRPPILPPPVHDPEKEEGGVKN